MTEPRSPRARYILFSYWYPPSPMVGGLRWSNMVRHFADGGFDADVISHVPPAQSSSSASPDSTGEVRVHAVPASRAALTSVVMGAYRAIGGIARLVKRTTTGGSGSHTQFGADSKNREEVLRSKRQFRTELMFLLDTMDWKKWTRRAAQRAMSIAGPEHKFVISSGPPHHAHLAAIAVSRARGIPFIMDMRDPWRFQQRYMASMATPSALIQSERLERTCIEQAALIVSNTDKHAQLLREHYPHRAGDIIVVRNGVDDELLERQAPDAYPDSGFVEIGHIGNIYIDRNPLPLIRSVVDANKRSAPPIRLTFLGFVGPADELVIRRTIRELGAEEYVRLIERQPRETALRFQQEQAGLVILPQDSDLAIPAKLFEYLSAPSHILAIAAHDSAVAELLHGTSALVVAPGDDKALIDALLELRRRQLSTGRPEPINRGGRFNRRVQSELLLSAIRERLR